MDSLARRSRRRARLWAAVTAIAIAGVGFGWGEDAARARGSGEDAVSDRAVRAAASVPRALQAARVRTGAPAATAAIYRCGRRVWSGASGVRSLGSRERVRVDTPFILASVTKTVTATMVLQLVEAGQLSLDESLSRFYPALPNAAGITIRQLLNHTSGLAEYTDDARIGGTIENEPAHAWTRDEALAGVGQPLFAPGARYRYTNTNYLVLGGVLEQLTGASIEQLFQTRVAPRARMPRSTFAYRPERSSAFAESYYARDGGTPTSGWAPGVGITSDTWGEVWTDGGLGSTAPETARFLHALFRDRLISRPLRRRMTVQGRHGYGLGIYAKSQGGHRWLGHDGSYGGYESEVWHDARRDVTIAVLTNLEELESADDTTSARIWNAVASAYGRRAPRSGCD